MSNIIDETEKRLGSMVPQAVYDLAREAATLRAENARLREVLHHIEKTTDCLPTQERARAALGDGGD